MPDIAEEFEFTDKLGETNCINGTATVVPAAVPAIAGNDISEILVRNKLSNPTAHKLEVSFDGLTYFTLNRSEHLVWRLKGGVKQVSVRSTSATCDYQIIINRELV